MIRSISVTICTLGFFISLYAIYVDLKKRNDSTYEAFCDFAPTISCSSALTSEYSHIFSKFGLIPSGSVLDFSNAAFGSVFYLTMCVLTRFMQRSALCAHVMLVLSIISVVLSFYLAYVLIQILHDICIICYATHVCNIALLATSAYNSWSLRCIKKSN